MTATKKTKGLFIKDPKNPDIMMVITKTDGSEFPIIEMYNELPKDSPYKNHINRYQFDSFEEEKVSR